MPLTLITGPANSAKAQALLDAYRAALGDDPLLIVPRRADAEQYRRELVESGVVLGLRVESFAGLERELARRAGIAERPLTAQGRERVAAAAIAELRPAALGAGARSPAFARSLVALAEELAARRVTPQRFEQAMRVWGGSGDWAVALGRLHGAYRRRLARLGRCGVTDLRVRALDRLRLEPWRWRAAPVLLYGFDDLDPLQLDTVITLAGATAVTVSLPYEAGREAFAGRATTFEELRPHAERIVALEPRTDTYEHAALHHLERSLFEAKVPAAEPADAVVLLEGASEHAELELVVSEVRRLLERGFAPADIAIVMRRLDGAEQLVVEACAEAAIPVALGRRERFADTRPGAALVGLLRAALGDGETADLLAWLRAPGVLERPQLADLFEADLRRGGVRDAATAIARWEERHWPLDAVGRLRAAAARRDGELARCAARELDRLLAAPVRRAAAPLESVAARAARVGLETLAELAALADADPSLAGDLDALCVALEMLEVETDGGAGVLVCDALSLRARRVRALFLCRMVEDVFPAPPSAPPLLSLEDRRELARETGLVLLPASEPLAAERYLFYALVSRPTAHLFASWHNARDDGAPRVRSLFVDDLCDCFGPALRDRVHHRGIGPAADDDVARWAWRRRLLDAPRRSAEPIGSLHNTHVLDGLRARPALSPSAIDCWQRCPVSWFVERLLAADALEPDGEYLREGAVAHEILASVLATLAERGLALGDPRGRAEAEELLHEALEARSGALADEPIRDAAARRRMRADLGRLLSWWAQTPMRHRPALFELGFGLPDSEYPAVALADGELVLRGRIDRVDTDSERGTAIVVDYKRSGGDGAARWLSGGRLQLALYMLAAARLTGRAVVGGLYQGLDDPAPRGALLDTAEPQLALPRDDTLAAGALAALLDDALGTAVEAGRQLRAGRLVPRPDSCSQNGGCRYPGICRP